MRVVLIIHIEFMIVFMEINKVVEKIIKREKNLYWQMIK